MLPPTDRRFRVQIFDGTGKAPKGRSFTGLLPPGEQDAGDDEVQALQLA